MLVCATQAFAQAGGSDAGGGAAGADQAGGGPKNSGARALAIDARLSTDLVWTDNIRTSGANKQSDFVATVSPGVRMAAKGDRLKGQVDYSLTRLQHANNQDLDRTQNALRAFGQIEAIDDFAFVDFTGSISQQSISAFGSQSDNDTSFNSNRTEVSTFRVSPYVIGRLGQWAAYTARYSRQTQHSRAEAAPDQNVEDILLQLRGATGGTALTWSLDATRQEVNFDTGVSFRSDRLRAVLGYPVTPQLVLSVIPGRESNNFITGEMQSSTTFGGSVDWRPSVRTRANGLLEKRFFGRAYQLGLEHRTPRTAWRFSDSRDASATPPSSGAYELGPLYELLFLQFSSIQPDPVLRAQLVDGYLQANGLDRNTQVRVGFLSSSAAVTQRRDLSFTLLGQRNTLTFLATQSRRSSLSQLVSAVDDFSDSAVIRQRGMSLLYSHRLTPDTSLSATASQVRTEGNSPGQQSTLNSLALSVTTRLGQHTSANFGLRRADYDNPSNPYTESTIRAGLNFQF